jgi:integrase
MARTKLKNIYLRRGHYRVAIRIDKKLRWHPEVFPRSTPLEELRAKIEELRQQYAITAAVESFADDVRLYLALPGVAKKRTLNQITAHLALWLHALGRDRSRTTITTAEVDAVLEGWETDGLAAGTIRKRRTSLRSFFVRMNGGKKSRRFNPVQHAYCPREPEAEDRSLDYATIEKAIKAMPERRSAKKGTEGELALARIRARVIAYTGLPPGVLMQLTETDLDFVAGRVYAPGREKGAGTAPRWCELAPEALAAFKDFHAANAYGTFSISSLGRSVKRGFARIGYTRPMRLYDLRHSFLAQVHRVTGDLATVGRLGLHVPGSKMTARYAMGANREVDAAAVRAFSASLVTRRRSALKSVSGRKLAKKVSQIA